MTFRGDVHLQCVITLYIVITFCTTCHAQICSCVFSYEFVLACEFVCGDRYECSTIVTDYLERIRVLSKHFPIVLVFCRECVRRVRLMLQPMKRGEPFDGSVSTNIRGIANLSIALGVISNVIELGGRALLVSNYDLTSLLLSDAITAVTVSYEVNFTFVGIFLILRLLASVFQYGTELQQLSDETL